MIMALNENNTITYLHTYSYSTSTIDVPLRIGILFLAHKSRTYADRVVALQISHNCTYTLENQFIELEQHA